MTSEQISLFASGLVAFALELIPPLKRDWDRLNSVQKQALIAGIVVIISLIAMWYTCRYDGQCPADAERAVIDMAFNIFVGLVGAQGAYKTSNYIGERVAYGKSGQPQE